MPEISQPAVVARILELPEPLAPPFTRAVFPEFADLGNRELSFDLGPLFRQWSWTWDYWPWTSYWPDLSGHRRRQVGLYRDRGPEVSVRGPPSWAFIPWWERASVEHENFLDE